MINICLNKIHRKSQYSVEEEFESSESEGSFRYKKKRMELFEIYDTEVGGGSKEEIGIYSNGEEDEKNEISSDLQMHYEDNLNNEIERILIDIYNNHITANKKRKMDINKYEKHVRLIIIYIID